MQQAERFEIPILGSGKARPVLYVYRSSTRSRWTERRRSGTPRRHRARCTAAYQRGAAAQATGEKQGFMKALVGENHDRILGFTMIGAAAGEVMAVVETAMLADLPYTRLREAVLAHPTMAEGLGFLFSNVPQQAVRQATMRVA